MKKVAPGPMPSGTWQDTGPLGVVTVIVLPAVTLAGHTTCICSTPPGRVGVGGARGGVPDRDEDSSSSAELRASRASASFIRSGSGSAMLRKARARTRVVTPGRSGGDVRAARKESSVG